MITDATAIYPMIHGLLTAITGLDHTKVIPANRADPAPSGLHLVYNPIPVRAVGHPRTKRELVDATEDFNESELGADWQDFEATTITQMEFMVSLNAHNEGARDVIMKMHNANFRWPVQEYLWANGIGYRYASETRDLTSLDRASYQMRFQADLHLWMEAAITDSVLRANDFEFTIEDEDGNVLYQEA